ncbi:MAG TPA: hypothetical protein VK198_13845 [Terriglobales bacterium]|nr:hypothetical protein [Terriglobales bacterium]
MNPFRGFLRSGIIRPHQAANFPPVRNPARVSWMPPGDPLRPRGALYAASQASARSRISPHFYIPIGKQKHQTIRFPFHRRLIKPARQFFDFTESANYLPISPPQKSVIRHVYSSHRFSSIQSPINWWQVLPGASKIQIIR